MQQWALIRTTHAQQSEQNTLAVIHTCCNRSCQLQWLLIFKMNTRSSRQLRKGRSSSLGRSTAGLSKRRALSRRRKGRLKEQVFWTGRRHDKMRYYNASSRLQGCFYKLLTLAHARCHCRLGQLRRRCTQYQQ